MSAVNQIDLPGQRAAPRRSRLRRLLRAIPIILIGLWVVLVYTSSTQQDLTTFFLPAGDLVASGLNPYTHAWSGPFVYPPLSLWFFVLLSRIPLLEWWMPLLNTALAFWLVRRLNASIWWVLYPPILLIIWLGQIDLIILVISLYACALRPLPSGLLMGVAIAIKPTVALFFIPRWLLAGDWRRRVIAAGGVFVIILLLSTPLPWQDWLLTGSTQTSEFVAESAAIATFAVVLMPVFFILALIDRRNDREWLTLGLPAPRHYSMAGITGGIHPAAMLIHWVLRIVMESTGWPIGFIEPLSRIILKRLFGDAVADPAERAAREA